MKPLLALVALLMGGLAACGGEAGAKELCDSGYAALGAGDHGKAHVKFGAALSLLDDGDPLWMRAQLGSVEAQAHLDPAASLERFLALGESNELAPEYWDAQATNLVNAGALPQARSLLVAAVENFPDEEGLRRHLENVTRKEAQQGVPQADSAIQDLGYAGGDDD